MRRSAVALCAFAMIGGSLLAWACGGSSSESPWPVEPLDTERGPAGEERERSNVIDVTKIPSRYGDAGAAGAGGAALDEPEPEPKPEPKKKKR